MRPGAAARRGNLACGYRRQPPGLGSRQAGTERWCTRWPELVHEVQQPGRGFAFDVELCPDAPDGSSVDKSRNVALGNVPRVRPRMHGSPGASRYRRRSASSKDGRCRHANSERAPCMWTES